MEVEELLRLYDDVDDKYTRIPKDNLILNIPCIEIDAYNIALDDFVSTAREMLCDENISYMTIRSMLSREAINQARALLSYRGDVAINALLSSPKLVRDTFQRLEKALAFESSKDLSYTTDPYSMSDQALVASFNANELASFRDLQDYIRGAQNSIRK